MPSPHTYIHNYIRSAHKVINLTLKTVIELSGKAMDVIELKIYIN